MALCEEGSVAPEFELKDQSGAVVRLSDLLEKGPVVVFFYPKDETRVCTLEACGFRDSYDEFAKLETTVIGISQDSVQSHDSFARNHDLPYLLLADPKGRVAGSFGVKKTLGLLPGRATFVIDRGGKIRFAFSSALDARAHVEKSLSAVRNLQTPSSSKIERPG